MNRGFDYETRVATHHAGLSLLRFLSEHYSHSDEPVWSRRIREGSVTLDGREVAPDTCLQRGQLVTWHRPPWKEPAAPLDVGIAYEDGDLVVAIKPAGLPTLPGAGFLEHTLRYQVQRRYPDAEPAHRLGRWTSGLVLCGRSPAGRAGLAQRFGSCRVRKQYLALADGRPRWRRRRISVPIGPVRHSPTGTLHAASIDGRPASSEVTVVERGRRRFVCSVEIATGRPHQIRIHLAAIGHPLSGDPLYASGGRPAADSRALPGDPGYRLHARRLSLTHPVGGARLDLAVDPERGWKSSRVSSR